MPIDRNYGQIAGLPGRIAYWVERTCKDASLPWVGLGLIADLEAVLRLLSLEEFGEWLRTQPDDKLAEWGNAVLEAVDVMAQHDRLVEDIDDATEHTGDTPPDELVKQLADDRRQFENIREALVETGALSADDRTTDLAGLVRALMA